MQNTECAQKADLVSMAVAPSSLRGLSVAFPATCTAGLRKSRCEPARPRKSMGAVQCWPRGLGALEPGSQAHHIGPQSGSTGPLELCHPWKLGCTEEAVRHHIQGATEMSFLGVLSLGVSKLQPSVTCSGQLILRAPQCSDWGIPQPHGSEWGAGETERSVWEQRPPGG